MVRPFDGERLRIVLQRQRVVAAPRLDEPAHQRHYIDDQREHRPRNRNAVAKAAHTVGQVRRQTRIALACERRIDLAPEQPPLREKGGERKSEQQDAERGGAALVELRTDH